MRRIIGSLFVSVDGVIQAPGGPTEDWTGGFDHGGWLAGLFDESSGAAIDRLFGGSFDLLLGRRTYDIFAAYWPFVEGNGKPMGAIFDRVAKYVVTHRDDDLDWVNSHRLATLDALAELKRKDGPDLIIQGSGTLYPQLLAAGLIDRLTLMTFPVVLGRGKRWFGDDSPPGKLRMVEHSVSPTGTIIASYEPDGDIQEGSVAPPSTSQREQARQERMTREENARPSS